MNIDEAERIWSGTLLNEWSRQTAAGELTDAGLSEVRRRLRAGELRTQPAAQGLLVQVVEALKGLRGMTQWPYDDEVIPAAPDDVSTLTGAPDSG